MANKFIEILYSIISKRITRLLFGVLIMSCGISLFLLGDNSFFFLIFFLTGIYILILSFIRMRNLYFYLITVLPVYYIVSMFYEGIIKQYKLEVTLPDHKKEFLFILSNTKLKCIDFPLTWFTSNTIKANLTDKSIIYLKRGMPYRITKDYEDIYKQGYSVYHAGNHRFDFIVFAPLIIKKNDTIKGNSSNNYSDFMAKNNDLQFKIIRTKIDSLEKL